MLTQDINRSLNKALLVIVALGVAMVLALAR